jgi:hypothetical protein
MLIPRPFAKASSKQASPMAEYCAERITDRLEDLVQRPSGKYIQNGEKAEQNGKIWTDAKNW